MGSSRSNSQTVAANIVPEPVRHNRAGPIVLPAKHPD
jgi:hypothetical protein